MAHRFYSFGFGTSDFIRHFEEQVHEHMRRQIDQQIIEALYGKDATFQEAMRGMGGAWRTGRVIEGTCTRIVEDAPRLEHKK
jgi:hypothetical protein